MPKKYKFTKVEEIPESDKALYVERDESGAKVWVADFEGCVDVAQLNQFRTNNISLQKQKADLEARFDGVDPEEARALKAQVAGLSQDELKEVLKKGKNIDEVVAARTKTMQEDHVKQITAKDQLLARTQTQLQDLLINQAVIEEATKVGLKPTAQLDIATRARQTFKLDASGKVVGYESDGRTLAYGKDAQPLTVKEWVEKMRTEAPHCFEDSKGGGAGGDGGGNNKGGAGGKNPFKKGTVDFNITNQMKMRKENPALARKMAAEAGQLLPD